MTRTRLPHLALAALLVLLPSLGLLHCACPGGSGATAESATAPSCHGTPARSQATTVCGARTAEDDDCQRLCAGRFAVQPSIALADPSSTLIALVTASESAQHTSEHSEWLPKLDNGSPPRRIDSSAHGQRAPPVSA